MLKKIVLANILITSLSISMFFSAASVNAQSLTGNGAYGISGTITSPPPSIAPTISSPSNSQSFTSVPDVITGVCVSGLLIKVYINGIFSGAAMCVNHSYSISADLFLGTNIIYADDYDSLNQAGPKSNVVTVSYVNNAVTTGIQVTITSDFAKLGADPGSALNWPIQISGGTAPYAISVNWGDGTQSELVSQATPGTVNLTHAYTVSGTYSVIINGADKTGSVAFLQVVGVANGPASQSNSGSSSKSTGQNSGLSNLLLALIIGILVVVPPSTFWLGKMHQKKIIEERFRKNLPLG